MLFNALLIAIREIRRNLTRSFLTVIGIVIGVAAVVTMVTLGRGATETIKGEISKMGSNLLVLRPGQGWWSRGVDQFSLADLDAIRHQINGVADIAPFVQTSVSAVYQENNKTYDVQGTTPNYFEIANWTLSSGRIFTAEEVEDSVSVCVIGETVRKALFGSVDPVGKRIRLGTTSAEVIGVTAAKGQGGFGDDLDDNIIVPYTSLVRRQTGSQGGRFVSQAMISGEDGFPSAQIVAEITNLLRERRNITGNEQDDFNVFDSQQLADVVTSSTKVMTSLLGAVAGVSLLVGGIGIMNIMLVSVTERTREIGIRLAIGARAREVLLQFLVEAITLSCIGGLAGILLAFGLCHALVKAVGTPFIFDPTINLIAFVFSAAIGILFGYMPARRAAALDPIDALRHE
ncbi:putative ABC transport system permease protein [Haloferula luteola]|uniref:Putative ABC transport system permease protein n=1 Tax=Haloferula luteola TaxID=595692 RepID=A0A840V0Y9_9BACT|nr:ABC transporter permease [Haloferula luteola]MBB5350736.1 putative ABC transport system permease protein [Haloferula luteola]